jgi:hypothetical protein
MAEITASLVKELRDRTGLGMMECKKALTEAGGDIELAIDNLRKSGQAKAAKKAGNVAAEGAILWLGRRQDRILLLEVNSQTDFVAKDANFTTFAKQVAEVALAAGETDAAKIAAWLWRRLTVEEARVALVQKIGENIQVRRAVIVTGDVVGLLRARHQDWCRRGPERRQRRRGPRCRHACRCRQPEAVAPADVAACAGQGARNCRSQGRRIRQARQHRREDDGRQPEEVPGRSVSWWSRPS